MHRIYGFLPGERQRFSCELWFFRNSGGKPALVSIRFATGCLLGAALILSIP
jgi:hypothetical protein